MRFKEGQSVICQIWPRPVTSLLSVAMKGRERSTIPSIHAQRLFMGHENNVATCVEELGCTKTYRRGKCASKRVKEPNLAQASHFIVVSRSEGEGKVHHSFNTCPEALHGS